MNIVKLFTALLVLAILAACGSVLGDSPVSSEDSTPVADVVTPVGSGIRSDVYIGSASLLIMESFPIQVRALVQGDLPTPCHMLTITVSQPDAENNIHIEMYSEAEEGAICIQMLQPFEESVEIAMTGQAEGDYAVYLNGALIGEFTYPGG